MKQIIAGLLALVLTSTTVAAQSVQAVRAMSRAMQAVEAEDWPAAARSVAGAGPVARDIVAWHRLRAGEGEFGEYIEFLERRADWPGLALLRTRGEANIPQSASPGQVIAYFADQLPRTGAGALRLAAAFSATGEVEKAHDEIVRVWRSLSLDEESEAAILAAYSGVLVNYHRARQDMLLWRGLSTQATRLNGLVGADHARLAVARIALMARKDGVNALISAVPGQLADDPGLAFARLSWRMAKRPPGEAAALMLQRSVSAKALGRPEAWADKRRRLARTMLREGEPRIAYRLAARHFLTGGDAYADLEWLAGYIALTGLKDYDTALRHFQNARGAVSSPISLGRAGYWEGRAYEAMGQSEEARLAYEFGGEFQTSFYGQLAAVKAGLSVDAALTGREVYADFRDNPHSQSSVFEAAMLFQRAGYPQLFARFVRKLAPELNARERGDLAQLALELDEPFAAIRLAKYAASQGDIMMRPYFPISDLADHGLPVSRELALAIMRRESEFNDQALSPAGASGLMQLMPRTGQAVAKSLNESFAQARLISDPAFNVRLGSAYLADLNEDFESYVPFVAAGYNAGPSRARRWRDEFGDPRGSVEAAVDWIENIPFRETRTYVKRVMEALAVYEARISGEASGQRLVRELTGR